MSKKQFAFYGGSGEDRYEEQLGIAAKMMCRSPKYRTYAMMNLEVWIEPAIRHRQIMLVYNNYNKPMAYLTWALLAPDVEERWVNDPNVLLHESEWNEGEQLWFMDFVAPMNNAKRIITEAIPALGKDIFVEYPNAKSLRRDQQGAVIRVNTWSNPFYKAPCKSDGIGVL